jgi:hypothetical protein
MLRELGLNVASSCLELFRVENGDFEGVAWPLPMAFGGAVCASKDWKPNQRASSRTFAVLA